MWSTKGSQLRHRLRAALIIERLSAIELQMAPIRTAVHIQWPIYLAVTKEGKSLESFDFLQQNAKEMIDQLLWWARALMSARSGSKSEKLKLAG